MNVLSSLRAGHVGPTPLALLMLLKALHQRGVLNPLFAEQALVLQAVEQARQAGLTISNEELQQAANRFRQSNGLASADQTNQWLLEQGLSVDDLEERLERDLLIEKFKDHLSRQSAAEHFAARKSAFDQSLLRLILVREENLARELQSQIVEEGRDFSQLSREHSLHSSSSRGGLLGWVRRSGLPTDVAARVFAASAGEVVGPFLGHKGASLFLVEAIRPAELNDETRQLIRQDLYRAWMKEGLGKVRLDFTWLKTAR